MPTCSIRPRHPVAIIAGESEFAAGTVQLKDLRAASQQDIAVEPIAAFVAAVTAAARRL